MSTVGSKLILGGSRSTGAPVRTQNGKSNNLAANQSNLFQGNSSNVREKRAEIDARGRKVRHVCVSTHIHVLLFSAFSMKFSEERADFSVLLCSFNNKSTFKIFFSDGSLFDSQHREEFTRPCRSRQNARG
jgi:hypothetical protein